MSRKSRKSFAAHKLQPRVQALAKEQRLEMNVGAKPDALATRWISIGGENGAKGRSQQVYAERAEQISAAEVEWLADARAPQGVLCVVAGEPGTCKSLLATEWAARVSNGREQRDAALIAHAADLPAPILRARLDAAGATIQRVAMATLRWPEPGDDASLAELDRRVAALACGIDEGNDARLII
ncbi:MAG TPA: AAA family ATPase, partial [Pirellulales bacterium]|nr:AAA family ATPase [Pirellulales bacterium]